MFSIHTIPNFIDAFICKLQGKEFVPAQEKIINDTYNHYRYLTDRSDLHVESRILFNVEEDDHEILKSLGAKTGVKDGKTVWFIPAEITDLSNFKPWFQLVPEDLADENVQFSETSDGRPWSNYVLPNDLGDGSDSSATALAMALIPVLASVLFLAGSLIFLGGLFKVIGMLVLLAVAIVGAGTFVAIQQGEDFSEAIKCSFLSGVFPVVILAMLTANDKTAGAIQSVARILPLGKMLPNAFSMTGSITGALVGGISLFIVGLVPLLLFKLLFGTEKSITGFFGAMKRVATKYAMFCLMIAITFMLPQALIPVAVFIYAALYPLFYTESNFKARTIDLQQQSMHYIAVNQDNTNSRQKKYKLNQIKMALDDKTTKVVLGKASGYMSKKGLAFGPDSGKNLLVTMNDLLTHCLVLGRTGSRKTSFLLEKVCQMREDKNNEFGLLVMCGKGTLARELEPVLDYNIKVGMDLNVVEGLTGKDVTEALTEILDTENAKDPLWSEGAITHIRYVSEIWENLVRKEEQDRVLLARKIADLRRTIFQLGVNSRQSEVNEKRGVIDSSTRAKRILQKLLIQAEAPRKFLNNYHTFYTLFSRVDDFKQKESGVALGDRCIPVFNTLGWDYENQKPDTDAICGYASQLDNEESMLYKAISYLQNHWWKLPEDTRNSFKANVQMCIEPLAQCEEFKNAEGISWTQLTTGADITDVMRGKSIGIDLLEAKYGKASTIVTNLLKKRVYRSVRRRADLDWKAIDGNTPFLALIDEAQLLIGQEERSLISISRSLGLGFVFLTQDISGLQAKFGDESKFKNFINMPQTVICLEASKETYRWISEKIGEGSYIQAPSMGKSIDYRSAFDLYAKSPLHDVNHPNRSYFGEMRDSGFGRITTKANHIAETFGTKSRSIDGSDNVNGVLLSAIVAPGAGQRVKGPLCEVSEIQDHLDGSSGSMALICATRANGLRVDFADVVTMRANDKRIQNFNKE